MVFGDNIHLIDCGVAGAEKQIFAYLEANNRKKADIANLLISHAHPDHIGAAATIKAQTDCKVIYHEGDRDWIEDTEKQFQDRPIPGFHTLVGGSVSPDILVKDGDRLELNDGLAMDVIHTPGHSRGSISLYLETESALVTADALPLPGDLPLYDDIGKSVASIKKLQRLPNIDVLFSSWEDPIKGRTRIEDRMLESLRLLCTVHETVCANIEEDQDDLQLCERVVKQLSLPPFAVNPVMAKAFASSRKYRDTDLF
jgi:glyoxylase-like metal-dependent hydrolase (beta-lactamase superfamily II)